MQLFAFANTASVTFAFSSLCPSSLGQIFSQLGLLRINFQLTHPTSILLLHYSSELFALLSYNLYFYSSCFYLLIISYNLQKLTIYLINFQALIMWPFIICFTCTSVIQIAYPYLANVDTGEFFVSKGSQSNGSETTNLRDLNSIVGLETGNILASFLFWYSFQQLKQY